MSTYNVYKVRYTLSWIDPDMPLPRYHNVIFVASDIDGQGHVHHVTGDIITGTAAACGKAKNK